MANNGALDWRIEQEGFDPAREREMESIFTIGNGYLGVRGAPDILLPASQGDLFIAGIFDEKQATQPYSELEFMTVDRGGYPYAELVSFPFPFGVRLALDEQPIDLLNAAWRDHRRILDLKRGILFEHYLFENDQGQVMRMKTMRCASIIDPHLLLQEIELMCEAKPGRVRFDTSLRLAGLEYDHPHLTHIVDRGFDPALAVNLFQTRASGFAVCIASRTTLVGSHRESAHWNSEAHAGEPLRFRRYISVMTSRDVADPPEAAKTHLHSKHWSQFDGDVADVEESWSEIWARADIRVTGAPAVEQALRFNSYHLRIAADHDPKVSVGARALSGRAYEGHVFWDVEIFMLPFYIHTWPDIARSLLMYRYHTLDGAKKRAAELGYRGACYAWESTVTGEDTTPETIILKTTKKAVPIFTGTEQVHVTADVAYGVWQYWEATRDWGFMQKAGVEILIETARFWATRCTRDGGSYHIRGVTGPDEYHHTVDDNAYTNWLAKFNLEKAIWAANWLQSERPQDWNTLASTLGIVQAEIEQWRALAIQLYLPKPSQEGIIEQFQGFFDLDDHPLEKTERFKAPISRLFDSAQINSMKLIKQADVLMLLYLFPDRFSPDVVAANYHYYEPITDHGSSLSPSIHAAIAARLGLQVEAERYWRQALWLDLSDVMANSGLGVHPACVGGTWQALVFGMLGVHFMEDGIANPAASQCYPSQWESVMLRLTYRGHTYDINVRNHNGMS